ncbi:delta-lactam-biosynthetic de-N-acetylase [Tenuibacillus multivorans]|uniref:Peptidoglycan-N-acetylmuramic acid deacetylase n=1 Tax=Tenuibacillus multivorans TaxID=237069 RepID=A0A1H0G068_9BACI|nr:delta-lactam-biosynthetic de-N-acetylase [Tenuibacillus multivorans]GEL78138.1 delta-lactam-biosynthetic de-N-acetylase [Tenuibacillus multivorans]SDO00211.1 peptidoglycan-N-acetylmuramic acid deacetylase [Tenuibacillus multivorans]
MKRVFLGLLAIVVWFSMTIPVTSEAYGYGYKKKYNEQPPDLGFYAPLIEKYNGIYMGDPDQKKVYLTFDNGYEQGYTGTILDILKDKKVPATFFLTGNYVTDNPDLVKRMVDEGHIIGNHSNKHLDFTKSSEKEIKEDLSNLDKKIKKYTEQDSVLFFRPAKGVFNEKSLALTDELGYINVFWTVAFVDWHKDRKNGWKKSFDEVMKQIHPGAIILLHTVSQDNADALNHMIDELRKRGYEFGSLEELLWEKLVPIS